MILSGHEIRKQLGDNIHIDPFDDKRLNPNSYNLSLHDELLVYEEIVLDMRKSNRVARVQIPEEGLVLNFIILRLRRQSIYPWVYPYWVCPQKTISDMIGIAMYP